METTNGNKSEVAISITATRNVKPALLLAAMGMFALTTGLEAQVLKATGGHVHPLARTQYDRGPVDPAMKMSYMSLFVTRPAAKQAELDRLLEQQQDTSSPLYHQWLTPEQFAERFGADQSDIDRVSSWLQSGGFSIVRVARGRDFIVFSGTSRQVEAALRTPIHRYDVDGAMHYANVSEPSVPEDLAPLVAGFRGLHDFKLKRIKRPSRFQPLKASGITANSSVLPTLSANGVNVLAPDDLAAIYNVNPLYQNGIDGSGQTIAIAGATDIFIEDIELFRSTFKLPFNDPRKILVPGSDDPGVNGDLSEADLDLEWSGAIARNATILYVYAADPIDAVFYTIDAALAPILSLSYGGCELRFVPGEVQRLAAEAQKAAAEGITWIASSGDAGSAACENQGQSFPYAITRMNPNLPASLPYVTGVGGTAFNEGNGNYWAGAPNHGSALGYVPERGWNDEDYISQNGLGGFASSGGGASWFFAKPSWQAGPGVPDDGVRDVPDIALTASWFHDPYVLVTQGYFEATGGTSAAAPAFAGMLALINQYVTGSSLSHAGLGLINPTLYSLAQSAPTAFHDITTGSNVVPCIVRSTQDCATGFMGYKAGPGYDLVTGLGSVDVYNLARAWRGIASRSARLAVTQFRTSTTAHVGGAFELSLTVTNQGTLDAGAFRIGIYFTLNGNIATAKDEYLYCDVSGLAAGQSSTCSGSVVLGPSIVPGTYFLVGVADVNKSVQQVDRSGNIAAPATGPLTVQP